MELGISHGTGWALTMVQLTRLYLTFARQGILEPLGKLFAGVHGRCCTNNHIELLSLAFRKSAITSSDAPTIYFILRQATSTESPLFSYTELYTVGSLLL